MTHKPLDALHEDLKQTDSDSGNLTSAVPTKGATAALPQYEHDCNHCIFLGRHEETGDYADAYDLYYHPAPPEGMPSAETVIARHGIDGAYYSGMHFASPYVDVTGADQPGIPMLVEARRRAIERGLLTPAP